MNEAMSKFPPTRQVDVQGWRGGVLTSATRALPEEIPVVLTYDRVSFAVMMATPSDLRDFAIGFSLSEGVITGLDDITALEIMGLEEGVECRMALRARPRAALENRRRLMAGPVGCGLCGIDSLEQALRPLPEVMSDLRVPAAAVMDMLVRMAAAQILNQATRAVHAAGFFNPARPEFLLREDVGRHNALDKLIGAAARAGDAGGDGALCITSRVSIELIQKAAFFGAPILVAVSVPTFRAVRAAKAAGITLAAVARHDGFEVFTHPERIVF